MDNISIQQKLGRPRIQVIFEFVCPKPVPMIYRGVQGVNGGYRMEKRGLSAKAFKTFMWCGDKSGLYSHKQAVEFCTRTGVLPFTFLATSEQI